MSYSQATIQALANQFTHWFKDLDAAYQSVLLMHPDQKGEPFSIHPNMVDNWVEADSRSNDSFFKWLIPIYKQLITQNSLPQNVVRPGNPKPTPLNPARPGTVQTPGKVSVYHVREWVKNPAKYASEIKQYPYTMAWGYAIDLGTLDAQLGQQILAIQDYNRKHPSDTTLLEALKPVVDTLASIAPIIQLVVSFVPGIGTIASMALGATFAAFQGKGLDEILESAAVGAIPGGPLVANVAKAAVNVAKAGVKGENVLKATGSQLYSAALQYIPNPKDRAIADKAIKSAASGKNVLTAAEQAALDYAIGQISDPNAQQLARDAVSGHLNPKTTLMALVSSNLPSNTFTDSLVAAGKNVLSNIQIPNSKDLLKNARDEIVATASNFITDADARKVIGDATSKLLSSCDSAIGHRPSTEEQQALSTIKDPAAKKIFQSVLSGHCSPHDVFASTDGKLVQVMVKADLDSNVAKLLLADSTPSPKVSAKGGVLSSAVVTGTLKSMVDGRWSKGSFMQLPGIGNPNEQFQPDGSSQWTAGFWIQVA